MRGLQLALAVALTCAASLGIVALSWDRRARAAPSPFALRSEPSPLERARGTVVSLDLVEQTVTLDVDKQRVKLRLDDRTTVFVHGKVATLEDLVLGTPVCAAWENGPVRFAEWLEPCAR